MTIFEMYSMRLRLGVLETCAMRGIEGTVLYSGFPQRMLQTVRCCKWAAQTMCLSYLISGSGDEWICND